MTKVKPIPDGYSTITPYLFIEGADKAIDFYQKAFSAQVKECVKMPNGTICHAELKIGNSLLMLAEECLEWDAKSPHTIGGSPVTLHLYVENVDEVYTRAVKLGAKVHKELQNQFYGDRSGSVIDPFGHTWHLATHIEDVSPEESMRRMAEMAPQKM